MIEFKVRHSRGPSWDVGQGTPEHRPGEHYPDDYAGRVVALLPADDASDPAGAADVVLDLTDEELAGLRERRLKADLTPVTMEDRFGACARELRLRFAEAGAFEPEREQEIVGAAVAANDLAQLAYEDEMREWRAATASAVFVGEPLAVCPVAPTLLPEPDRPFTDAFMRLSRALPPNRAESGTGLYFSKKVPAHNDDTQVGAAVDHGGSFTITLLTGGLGTVALWAGGYVTNATEAETAAIISHTDTTVTLEEHAGITIANWTDGDDLDVYDAWATIQGALDQLWTDEGAAAFTASQYVRFFAGSYDENVIPNAGLNPDEVGGYLLIFEGDPTTARDSMEIAPAAGNHSLFVDCDQILVRHMKIAGTPAVYMVETETGCGQPVFEDCTITGAKTAIWSRTFLRIRKCDLTITSTGTCVIAGYDVGAMYVQLSTISGPGKATSTGFGIYSRRAYGSDLIEGCTISGFRFAFQSGNNILRANADYVNNTVYDCTYGEWVSVNVGFGRKRHFNNIFEDVDYPHCVREWPEETATQAGDYFVLRNNCYHGYTAFAYNSDTTTKTYAEFIALNQVDAIGNLDATDPLMTDPASDDFSLQAGSPCRKAGHGSGVVEDYLGVAFDAHHPDIGAWSGTETITTPVWPATLPQTVDQPQYSEGLADVVVRSDMESGPAQVRRRFTSGIQSFSATTTLSIAQAATLQTFFDTTLRGGSLAFQWTHPRTGAAAELRFVAPPMLTQRGPTAFVASLALEILP